MRAVAILAVIGLMGSLAWHALALIGRVTEIGIAELVLVVGLFPILLPAIWVGVKRAHGAARAEAWQAMLGSSAKWPERLMSGTLLYVFVLGVLIQKTNYLSWLGSASRTQILISGGWLVCYMVAAVLLRLQLGGPFVRDATRQNRRSSGQAV